MLEGEVNVACRGLGLFLSSTRILPEEDHLRLPGEVLREDLAVALLVLGAVAATGLPRQAAFADEHLLCRKARLGRQLGVDVIEGGADFLGLAARLQP